MSFTGKYVFANLFSVEEGVQRRGKRCDRNTFCYNAPSRCTSPFSAISLRSVKPNNKPTSQYQNKEAQGISSLQIAASNLIPHSQIT
ncbi:hypothetical protein MTBMA_c11060 [Methanothermobacter marburgensis str. Marburg]|uniref:Uncharacterized protein n=1 Tax=Methanothermobacter marburgensis (strain ATCC BAA-927 / DSM 2133 / JCM 14651 / NBRC 100331 / OCM 82 / Marburg) TaxID=79929 RepID=D9PWV2_METTM|nr:hypothetical protein MTBMA_c11060 [Methanothermobacter marburgensis str. Marburg]